MTNNNKEWEEEFDETMIEDWLDADAHSSRLPVKFNFSDMQLIGELLNPRIKQFINKLLQKERQRICEEIEKEPELRIEGRNGEIFDGLIQKTKAIQKISDA